MWPTPYPIFTEDKETGKEEGRGRKRGERVEGGREGQPRTALHPHGQEALVPQRTELGQEEAGDVHLGGHQCGPEKEGLGGERGRSPHSPGVSPGGLRSIILDIPLREQRPGRGQGGSHILQVRRLLCEREGLAPV